MNSFEAEIVDGEGRGSKLGFSTINLDYSEVKLEFGVYLGRVLVDKKEYLCLIHFGPKKTFSDKVSLEVYIEEKITNFYTKSLEIVIIKRIRDIEKFLTEEDLKKQIKKDKKFLKKD
jgi:riboflavin kinase/FMN adenylyltransferase